MKICGSEVKRDILMLLNLFSYNGQINTTLKVDRIFTTIEKPTNFTLGYEKMSKYYIRHSKVTMVLF